VEEKPDLTDQEVAWEFHRRTGRSVSRSSMNRVLLKLALIIYYHFSRAALRGPLEPGRGAPVAVVHQAVQGCPGVQCLLERVERPVASQ
jgi:hypothetical protein